MKVTRAITTRQLDEKVPFPFTEETIKEIKEKANISYLEDKRFEKFVLTETAFKTVDEMKSLYNKYMDILHSYNCNIEWNDNLKKYVFSPNYDGKAAYREVVGIDAENSSIDSYNERIFFVKASDNVYNHRLDKLREFAFNDKFHQDNYLGEELVKIYNSILSAYHTAKAKAEGYKKGDVGEDYVEKELELFKNKYKFINNVVFDYQDSKGKTSETDLYVITKKGILVCEIKNKGNEKYIFKITKDGQWSKCDAKGNLLEVMEPSPFAQNTRHCLATEKILEDNGIRDYKIIPVVIIGNETARIDNSSSNIVIRTSELYNLIEGLGFEEKYDEEYQNRIIDIFNASRTDDENTFPIHVVRKDAWNILDVEKDILETLVKYYDYEFETKRYIYSEERRINMKRLKIRNIVFIVSLICSLLGIVLTICNGFSAVFLLPIVTAIISGIIGIKGLR